MFSSLAILSFAA